MKYIAFTVKGLEEVAKDEILQLVPSAQVLEVAPKRVVFQTEDIMPLLKLTTVDDIGLFVGQYKGSMDKVFGDIIGIDFKSEKNLTGNTRTVNDTFSVTITKARVKLNTEEFQGKIAKAISDKYGWQYTKLDHTNFDIRIFIDQKDIYVSVRLTERPLFHRGYKTTSVKGALRPTIASAMVKLATKGSTGLVVDNFCGSGTVLAEALNAGNKVYGGDVSEEAVKACITTLGNMSYQANGKIKEQNATKTSWSDNYFDFAISNLPWDKQIEIDSVTNLYIGTLSEYARIVKSSGSVCLLVSNPDLLAKHAKKYFPNKNIDRLTIGYLGQKPTIVTIS